MTKAFIPKNSVEVTLNYDELELLREAMIYRLSELVSDDNIKIDDPEVEVIDDLLVRLEKYRNV